MGVIEARGGEIERHVGRGKSEGKIVESVRSGVRISTNPTWSGYWENIHEVKGGEETFSHHAV